MQLKHVRFFGAEKIFLLTSSLVSHNPMSNCNAHHVLTGAESWFIGHIAAVVVSVAVAVQAYTSAIPAGKLADPARGTRMCAPQQDAQREQQENEQDTRPPTHPAMREESSNNEGDIGKECRITKEKVCCGVFSMSQLGFYSILKIIISRQIFCGALSMLHERD